MGESNKENLRQAMKELLGLVGFGPEEETAAPAKAEQTATEKPVAAERPAAKAAEPAAEEPQVAVEREPKVERPKEPAVVAEQVDRVERSRAAELPKVERPKVEPAAEHRVAEPATAGPQVRQPTVEQPKVAEPAASAQPQVARPQVERPVAAEGQTGYRQPTTEGPTVPQPAAQSAEERPQAAQPGYQPRPAVSQPAAQSGYQQPTAQTGYRPGAAQPAGSVSQPAEPAVDLETTRQKVASAVERTFFSFGGRREKKEKEPAFDRQPEPTFEREAEKVPVYEPAVEPVYRPSVSPVMEEPYYPEEPATPPFIRPGATVIAAGATFFGDIRAEGDVEVLGKLKGNLEATGNVRIVGKVLGDVKGDAVVLEGSTVQGNITSTSFVSLDGGAMVVGDVLATDFQSDGKVKGNLQIARAANFTSCALLAGNVVAATIVMAQGARVQGAVRIAEDPETNALFGDLEI